MDEAGILRVFSTLDIDFARSDPEWVVGHCPLAPYKFEHKGGVDRNPGFGIRIEEDDVSHYNCFTCKSTGTIGGLAMQLGKYRDEPALIELGKEIDKQEILGGGTSYEWQDAPATQSKKADRNTNFPDEAEWERQYPSVLANASAARYLQRRGISPSTSFRLGLRYDPSKRRIMFPVYDYWTGRYAGCSCRSVLSADTLSRLEDRTGKPHPKVRDYHGLQKDRLLLHGGRNKRRVRHRGTHEHSPRHGMGQSANHEGYILPVEGLFAFAHFCERGYGDITYALLGSKLLPAKAGILADIGKPLVWFTDNDPAGQSCLYGKYDREAEQYDNLGALHMMYHNVAQFVPTYPDGVDDPDDLTRYDIDRMIDEAELYTKHG